MADNRIGLEVDIPVGKAEEGVKSLRAQLASLKKEIGALDEADPKFDKLVKEAAALEDKMGDINQRVKALASDTKNLEGFSAAVSGIAGGFAAAQGAMGLFAEENEDLQKSILKVQSAMALLNGVQEVANQLNKDSAAMIFLQAQAMKVYTAAVGTSTGALKAFRIALVATGIGALVVALGLIVANWDKITGAIKKSTGPLKDFGEMFNKVKQIASGVFDAIIAYYTTIFAMVKKALTGDFKGAVEEARNIGKNVAKAYSEGAQEEAEKQAKERADALIRAALGDQTRLLARIEAAGEDTFKLREKILQDELQLLEAGTEEYLNKLNEIDVLRISNEKKIQDERNKIALEARKKREEDAKREEERIKQENEKRIEEERKHQEQIQEIINRTREEIELNNLEGEERKLRELELAYQKEIAIVGDNQEALRVLSEKYFQDILAVQDEYAMQAQEARFEEYEARRQEEDRVALEEIEREKAKRQALQDLTVNSARATGDFLMNIATVVGNQSEKQARRQFEIQKAASIVNTSIKTFEAAQSAYASLAPIPYVGPILGAIAAAAAVAAGIKNIDNIRKQQFGAANSPQTSNAAPPSLGTGGGQTPQLNPDIPRATVAANDRGELTSRVIVVESDITKTQERVRRIDQRATVV